MGKYSDLAQKIGDLVDEKNAAYGSSFDQAGDFLKLLYPNGIPVDSYTDALCIVRIFDKLKRLGNASNLPVNEGKIDAWKDIVGYGLLGLHKDSAAQKVENAEPSATSDDVQEVKEKTFEEKKSEEQGYYKLNSIMADRAKAEHEEFQKEKMRKMIEESRQAAQQKVEALVQSTQQVEPEKVAIEETVKKKDEVVQENKMIKVNCRLCGLLMDQEVSEAEIKAGKIVVHSDCYSKWQREQKLKQNQQ
jgi:hypothetical protein